MFDGELGDAGGDGAAGTAPGGVAVDDDEAGRVLDLFVEFGLAVFFSLVFGMRGAWTVEGKWEGDARLDGDNVAVVSHGGVCSRSRGELLLGFESGSSGGKPRRHGGERSR